MPTQETHQICKDVVQKLTMGKSLEDAEKSHLASCEACMAEVVKTLDEATASVPQPPSTSPGGASGDSRCARPEAKRALEKGRRVLEREFGIFLSKN